MKVKKIEKLDEYQDLARELKKKKKKVITSIAGAPDTIQKDIEIGRGNWRSVENTTSNAKIGQNTKCSGEPSRLALTWIPVKNIWAY